VTPTPTHTRHLAAQASIAQAARDILASIEATYVPMHEYARVDPSQFRHLDLAFYDRTATMLCAHGFHVVANVEDLTISNSPATMLDRIMIRSLLSRDGTVMASCYHPRVKHPALRVLLWLLRKLPGKVVDMETEFTDGSFVLTSNASSAEAITLPAMMSVEFHPFSTSAERIMRRHKERVSWHLAQRRGVAARIFATHDDIIASQNRLNALKAAFRGEVGGITEAELEQLSVFGSGFARDVHHSAALHAKTCAMQPG
jgi:hypothetical protein